MDVPSLVEFHADTARAAQGLMQTKCPAFFTAWHGPDRLERLASLQTEEAAISGATLEDNGLLKEAFSEGCGLLGTGHFRMEAAHGEIDCVVADIADLVGGQSPPDRFWV